MAPLPRWLIIGAALAIQALTVVLVLHSWHPSAGPASLSANSRADLEKRANSLVANAPMSKAGRIADIQAMNSEGLISDLEMANLLLRVGSPLDDNNNNNNNESKKKDKKHPSFLTAKKDDDKCECQDNNNNNNVNDVNAKKRMQEEEEEARKTQQILQKRIEELKEQYEQQEKMLAEKKKASSAAVVVGGDSSSSSFSENINLFDHAPSPPSSPLKFDAGKSSSLKVLMRENDNIHPSNLLFENVVLRGNTIFVKSPFQAPSQFESKLEMRGLNYQVVSELPSCDRTLDGTMMYINPQTADNVWHIHNDDVLPVYHALYFLGYGNPSTPKDNLEIIVGDEWERCCGTIDFFWHILKLMFDKVHDNFHKGQVNGASGQSVCIAQFRIGRPHRLFNWSPQHILFYKAHNLGQKYAHFVLSRAGLSPRRRHRWPPKVVVLQRQPHENRHMENLDLLMSAYQTLGISWETVSFTKSNSVEEQMRIANDADIFYAAHGGGNGLLWFLPDDSVFVHVLPHPTTQWELAIIRNHAQHRNIGYLTYRPDRGREDEWKMTNFRIDDNPGDAYLMTNGVLMEYLNRNPYLREEARQTLNPTNPGMINLQQRDIPLKWQEQDIFKSHLLEPTV